MVRFPFHRKHEAALQNPEAQAIEQEQQLVIDHELGLLNAVKHGDVALKELYDSPVELAVPMFEATSFSMYVNRHADFAEDTLEQRQKSIVNVLSLSHEALSSIGDEHSLRGMVEADDQAYSQAPEKGWGYGSEARTLWPPSAHIALVCGMEIRSFDRLRRAIENINRSKESFEYLSAEFQKVRRNDKHFTFSKMTYDALRTGLDYTILQVARSMDDGSYESMQAIPQLLEYASSEETKAAIKVCLDRDTYTEFEEEVKLNAHFRNKHKFERQLFSERSDFKLSMLSALENTAEAQTLMNEYMSANERARFREQLQAAQETRQRAKEYQEKARKAESDARTKKYFDDLARQAEERRRQREEERARREREEQDQRQRQQEARARARQQHSQQTNDYQERDAQEQARQQKAYQDYQEQQRRAEAEFNKDPIFERVRNTNKTLMAVDPALLRDIIDDIQTLRANAIEEGREISDKQVYMSFRRMAEPVDADPVITEKSAIVIMMMDGKANGSLPF